MASSSLGLLIWALSTPLADTCLCCWPDAAKYFRYDVQLLVGDGNKDVVEKLEKLFMGSSGKCALYGGSFLEREDTEREAGNLFLHLQEIIQKQGKDPDQLMTEAQRQKQNFSKRLEEVSKTFLAELCNVACERNRFRPYELADCASCRLVKATCNDPVLCAGPNVFVGVLVTILILLAAGAGVWYYRRKKMGGESTEQGGKDTGSSKSSGSYESTEWSNDSSPIYENVPRPPAQQNPPSVPSPPHTWNPPTGKTSEPTYENLPRPPDASYTWRPPAQQNPPSVPSPPHIWSPPPGKTSKPIYEDRRRLPQASYTWSAPPSPPHIWSPR